MISFADDTTLIFSDPTWEGAFKSAEAGLLKVKKWLDHHILTLNHKKSVYITFSANKAGLPPPSRKLRIHLPQCISTEGISSVCQCPTLENVHKAKYLGVWIDQHLKWDCHIADMCQRLRFLVYKFYKINKLNNLHITRLVYFAYAQSILQYGIGAWGGALDTHFNRIWVIQKHILRAALGRPRRYPSRDLCKELNVLPLRKLYIKNLILYINVNRNSFILRRSNYNLRPNSSNTFETTRTDLNVCRRQIGFICDKLVNHVPEKFITKKITNKVVRELEDWLMDFDFQNMFN